MLSVVSTPIGNLDDITLRAVKTLRAADIVVCEDTRRTGSLLKRLGIKKPLISMNGHSEKRRLGRLISLLNEGRHLALVSDSGTPLISDPGYLLVREAAAKSIAVSPVPGPSSVCAALSCSGLPTDRFAFQGFLPKKKKARAEALKRAAQSGMTTVFFESPHRIEKTLEAAAEACPDAELCICREMTKMHEELVRGTAAGLWAMPEKIKRMQKGEIVIVMKGARTRQPRLNGSLVLP